MVKDEARSTRTRSAFVKPMSTAGSTLLAYLAVVKNYECIKSLADTGDCRGLWYSEEVEQITIDHDVLTENELKKVADPGLRRFYLMKWQGLNTAGIGPFWVKAVQLWSE